MPAWAKEGRHVCHCSLRAMHAYVILQTQRLLLQHFRIHRQRLANDNFFIKLT